MTSTHYSLYLNHANHRRCYISKGILRILLTIHAPLERKRRHSEDEDMSDAQPFPPRPLSDQQRIMPIPREATNLNAIKRHKGEIQQRSNNDSVLDQLASNDLVKIMLMIYSHHPELRQEIMDNLPAPSFQNAADAIKNSVKRLNDSFPYNRNGESRNAYTFSRVRVPLVDLIDTIKHYCQYFTTSHIIFTPTSFEFLNFATEVAHDLPDWDEQEQNVLKYDLYHDLNTFWTRAIQSAASKLREGETYNTQTITEWTKQLVYHNNRTKGMFSMALNEFTSRLGFLITPPRLEAPICKDAAVDNNMVRPVFSSPQVVGYADAGR
ncbi:Cut8 six-helix bundle-domain-containing protein [Dichotomocladium elegans]|nr:Cut8 six-helix bundle-domain-containing protein [Dichotomocladium elegans]